MAKAKQISLDGTLIDIGGYTEIWDVTLSGSTYSITGHSAPYTDITSILNKNGSVLLRDSYNRLFYLAGNFGSGSEQRYSFTYEEAYERKIFNVYSNNSIAYNTPAGGAPQFHQSTDTTYGTGTQSAYGHVKVIDNVTSSSYTAGEALAAHQGYILKQAVDSKQDSITGGATTITNYNLTAGRVLVSNDNGKVSESTVNTTALGYLSGVTSSIQTQLNGKAAMSHANSTVSVIGAATQDIYGHVKVANNLTTTSYSDTAPVVLSAYQGYLLKQGQFRANSVNTTTGLGAKSIASGSAQNYGTIRILNYGFFLLIVTARWTANSNGYRQLWLSDTSGGSPKSFAYMVSSPATAGAVTSQQMVCFIRQGESTNYYVVVNQNSGSDIDCDVMYANIQLSNYTSS